MAKNTRLGELQRVEVASETLSHSWDDIRPPVQEVSSTILPKVEESAAGSIQELEDEETKPTIDETKTES